MTTLRLRALVIEDEWPARNYLVELLQATGHAEVVGALSSIDEAREALGGTSPLACDVAFVDVQLSSPQGETGLDLIRSARSLAHAPLFVLATAYRDHALEAYELDVADYLVKPFTEERVQACVRKLLARHRPSASPTPTRVVARRGKNLVFLSPEEVWAFEASDRLTFVHTARGVFDLDLSLATIEAAFGHDLTRVHRQWLVSTHHIKELERDGMETRLYVGAAMNEPHAVRVPVARERANAVREMLLQDSTGLRRGS